MKLAVGILAAAGAMVLAAPAQADGNQASAEADVQQVYQQVQARCTPSMPPSFQRIVWDQFTGGVGQGRIVDANPRLGGPFQVLWGLGPAAPAGYRVMPAQPYGYWAVMLEFC